MPRHSDITDPTELHYSLVKTFLGIAPNLVVADFVGQILCDGSTNQLYRATSTFPGGLQAIGIDLTALQSSLDDLALLIQSKADAADLNTHTLNTNNPHLTNAAQVGATPVAHMFDYDNPHQVTPNQIGAASLIQIGAQSGICPLGADGIVPAEFLPAGNGGGSGSGDGNDSAPPRAWIDKAQAYAMAADATVLYAWNNLAYKDFNYWISIEFPEYETQRVVRFNDIQPNLEICMYRESDLENPEAQFTWDGISEFAPVGMTVLGKIFISARPLKAAAIMLYLTMEIVYPPPPGG